MHDKTFAGKKKTREWQTTKKILLELHKFYCLQQFFTMFRMKCTAARKEKNSENLSQGEHTKRAIQWFSSFYESNPATINTFYSYAYAFAVAIGSCFFFFFCFLCIYLAIMVYLLLVCTLWSLISTATASEYHAVKFHRTYLCDGSNILSIRLVYRHFYHFNLTNVCVCARHIHISHTRTKEFISQINGIPFMTNDTKMQTNALPSPPLASFSISFDVSAKVQESHLLWSFEMLIKLIRINKSKYNSVDSIRNAEN